MKQNDGSYIYTKEYMGCKTVHYYLHDADAGFDYSISEYDIKRNIKIHQDVSKEDGWLNARLDDKGQIKII